MSLKTSQVFFQPVTAQDSEDKQSVAVLVDALKQLHRLATNVFDKVDKEHVRVQQLRHKVANCQAKVKQLKGTKQAVQVISSTKYPIEEAMPRFDSMYESMEYIDAAVDLTPDMRRHIIASEASAAFNAEQRASNFDLLSSLHLRASVRFDEDSAATQGLGPLPSSLTSVSSMLLFNSRENPYKDYRSLDNLQAAEGTRERTESKAEGLADAPTTLGSSALPGVRAQDNGYQPKLQEAVDIELAPDLAAALPDVAEIAWEAPAPEDSDPAPAPSGGGGGLLAEIQRGKKLKKAPALEEKPQPGAPAPAPAGGMFAELASKAGNLRKAKPVAKKERPKSAAEIMQDEIQEKFRRRRARVEGEDEDVPTAAGERARRASQAIVSRKRVDTGPKVVRKPKAAVSGATDDADSGPAKRKAAGAPAPAPAVAAIGPFNASKFRGFQEAQERDAEDSSDSDSDWDSD